MNLNASDILGTMGRKIPAANPLAALGTGAAVGGAPATGFWQVLKQQAGKVGAVADGLAAAGAQHQKEAEKAAGDLISNALILPMLKQLRRSPWGENTVFSRGIGEKTFGPQFDMQISDRIAHSPRLGLKASLTQKLLRRGNAGAVAGSKTNGTLKAKGLDTHG